MAGGKASNFSDLIQKVASSCIITPLPCRNAGDTSDDDLTDQEDDGRAYSVCYRSVNGRSNRLVGEEEEEEEERFRLWEEEKRDGTGERAKAAEGMMAELFEAVSAVKRAYVKLQEAHCPWDPERMRAADAAVVAELRRLGRLKERWWFRRGGGSGGEGVGRAAAAAAVEELKRELRAKEAEVEGLKERLRRGSDDGDGGCGGRRRSSGHRGARRKGSQGK